jgi:hypothetical protein
VSSVLVGKRMVETSGHKIVEKAMMASWTCDLGSSTGRHALKGFYALILCCHHLDFFFFWCLELNPGSHPCLAHTLLLSYTLGPLEFFILSF